MAGQRQLGPKRMQAQQDPRVVGDSRKFYYGKDWVLVKVVEPTSVASGWLNTTMPFLAKTENFSAIIRQTEIFLVQLSRFKVRIEFNANVTIEL